MALLLLLPLPELVDFEVRLLLVDFPLLAVFDLLFPPLDLEAALLVLLALDFDVRDFEVDDFEAFDVDFLLVVFDGASLTVDLDLLLASVSSCSVCSAALSVCEAAACNFLKQVFVR